MDVLKAVILGVIQGLAEFLPISSSGHLVVFQKLFGIASHDLTFDVVVHLATLCSVFTVMRRPIMKIIGMLFSDLRDRTYGRGLNISMKIVVGTIPAAIVGLTLKDQVEALFSSTFATGIFFLFTAALLFSTRWLKSDDEMSLNDEELAVEALSRTTYLQAFLVGIFQAIAIAPGVSRSGSTIVGGLMLRMTKTAAAYFSFMLALPAILGAAVLQFSDVSLRLLLTPYVAAGFLGAYISGVLALTLVLRVVKSGRLDLFAIYMLFIAGFTLFYFK